MSTVGAAKRVQTRRVKTKKAHRLLCPAINGCISRCYSSSRWGHTNSTLFTADVCQNCLLLICLVLTDFPWYDCAGKYEWRWMHMVLSHFSLLNSCQLPSTLICHYSPAPKLIHGACRASCAAIRPTTYTTYYVNSIFCVQQVDSYEASWRVCVCVYARVVCLFKKHLFCTFSIYL